MARKLNFHFAFSEELTKSYHKLTGNENRILKEHQAEYKNLLPLWSGEVASPASFRFPAFPGPVLIDPPPSRVEWCVNLVRKPLLRFKYGKEKFEHLMKIVKKKSDCPSDAFATAVSLAGSRVGWWQDAPSSRAPAWP